MDLTVVMVDAVYHRKPPDGRIRIGASQSAGADPGTVINPTADPTKTLQSFTQDDLAQFTLEQRYSDNPSNDFHLFYVGRDDVHEILKYILSRARVLLYLNMFGFDDGELNTILMEKAKDPNVTMLVTLDESQGGGKRERQLIELDQSTEHGLAALSTHFAIGQSATHQISQTKRFFADGKVGAEGSTNWSASGEGTFVVTDIPAAPATRRGTTRNRSSPTQTRSLAFKRSWSRSTLPHRKAALWWDRPARSVNRPSAATRDKSNARRAQFSWSGRNAPLAWKRGRFHSGTIPASRLFDLDTGWVGVQVMDEQRVAGGVKKAIGTVKMTVGKTTGNRRLKLKGQAERTEGRVRSAVSKAKDAVREIVGRH